MLSLDRMAMKVVASERVKVSQEIVVCNYNNAYSFNHSEMDGIFLGVTAASSMLTFSRLARISLPRCHIMLKK